MATMTMRVRLHNLGLTVDNCRSMAQDALAAYDGQPGRSEAEYLDMYLADAADMVKALSEQFDMPDGS